MPPLALAAALTLLWHAVLFAAAELVPSQDAPHLGATLITLCTLPVPVLAALAMGGWRHTGFAPIRTGVPGFGVTVPLFLVGAVYAVPGIEGDGRTLVYLALFCLVVGVTEESLSRGVVQHVLARMGRLPAAVWVGVLFGLGHALSGAWFGRDLGDTLFQVLSTAAFGFGYAAVRFHLATIWPLVAAHALYNFVQYASPGAAPWPVQLGVAAGFVCYGLWLLRRLDHRSIPDEEAPAPAGAR
ncbi:MULTISPECIES: CPBP family intramembrane glutamic endopeptidase [Nocardiopsis]|uniref:CPBP family intramembrane glutamic endopeptidase n=1 Tax=Nocardiopsis TaxID=2013 RepID=UPI001478CDC8|nr:MULTISPECIES: CPBP family intramembrane glutamic endopeptidase [Nocardiopsis]